VIAQENELASRSRWARVGKGARRILPDILVLLLLLTALGIYHDVQLVRWSIASGYSPPNPSASASTTLVPAEADFTAETITVTSTIFAAWSEQTSVAAEEPPLPSPPEEPVAVSIPSTELLQSSPAPITHVTRSVAIPADPTTSSAVPIPEWTSTESNGLIPVIQVPFAWPPRIEREHVAKIVSHGIGRLWQTIRRIYHYPLDPP
jgi:hypothetical protein